MQKVFYTFELQLDNGKRIFHRIITNIFIKDTERVLEREVALSF